ncbi:GNAT family N-acetyltransferase [Lampropedia puyangensis]|nr:GNAT family N-acetyltransferase [Lampropedia puyangensis]
MESVGWGSHYSEELVQRSLAAYPYVAYVRSDSGALWGYVSAFSDHAFSTMLGELVVHPLAQGKGIGRALLSAVESEFTGIPIYVKPLGDAKRFFVACGYRAPAIEMQVLFKRNGATD